MNIVEQKPARYKGITSKRVLVKHGNSPHITSLLEKPDGPSQIVTGQKIWMEYGLLTLGFFLNYSFQATSEILQHHRGGIPSRASGHRAAGMRRCARLI